MGEKLILSVSPHLTGWRTTQNIMLDVIISLCPAAVVSVIIFGLRALAVYAATILSAVIFEFLFDRIMKKENTIGDLSAVITGMLLAMNLPVTIPLWQAVVGSFFAIVLPMVAEWPAVPVIFLSVVFAFIMMARKTFDWKNFVSVLIGAAIIQLFCFIA